MELDSIKKKKSNPQMPKEAFRGHPWYRHIHEFVICGRAKVPLEFKGIVTAILERIGYAYSVTDENTDGTVELFGDHEHPSFYPDNEAYAKMITPELILLELGGPEFIMTTGCRNLIADGDTLRMNLGRNKSGANLLYITRTGSEKYSMCFERFRRGSVRVDSNGRGFSSPDTIKEMERYDGVYGRTLRDLFEEVTGYATRKPEIYRVGTDGQKRRIE